MSLFVLTSRNYDSFIGLKEKQVVEIDHPVNAKVFHSYPEAFKFKTKNKLENYQVTSITGIIVLENSKEVIWRL